MSHITLSDLTHPSSVDCTVSLHTGQVLWLTFHCSMHGRQYECAQGKITSGFLSKQTQHSSNEVPSSRAGESRASSRNIDAETRRGRGFLGDCEVPSRLAGLEGSELSGEEVESLIAAVWVCNDLKTDKNCLRVSKRYESTAFVEASTCH